MGGISKANLMKSMMKEMEFKKALDYNRKEPLLYQILVMLRKKHGEKMSVREISKALDGKVSPAKVQYIKENFPYLIKDNNLFRDFLEAIGIDPEENKKEREKEAKKRMLMNKAQQKKEKQAQIKKEMEKAKIILAELNNDKMPETEKWKLVEGGRRQYDKLTQKLYKGGELDDIDGIKELLEINVKIITEGKHILRETIKEINPKKLKLAEAKKLSDIIDTAFKQNRLIRGESTENVAIGVVDIYDQIVDQAQNSIEETEKQQPILTIQKSPENTEKS